MCSIEANAPNAEPIESTLCSESVRAARKFDAFVATKVWQHQRERFGETHDTRRSCEWLSWKQVLGPKTLASDDKTEAVVPSILVIRVKRGTCFFFLSSPS